MPTSKKPRKKYDKHKIRDDYILRLEHQTGLFAKSFNFIINELLQNNAQVTAHNVANDFIMIYRFTFLYELLYSDISCQNIREIIEDKLNILNELALSPDLQDYAPIEILLSERQLICLMVEQLRDKLFKIRSRLEYAKITKQMIVDYIQATIMSKLGPEEQTKYQEALQSGEIMTPE